MQGLADFSFYLQNSRFRFRFGNSLFKEDQSLWGSGALSH